MKKTLALLLVCFTIFSAIGIYGAFAQDFRYGDANRDGKLNIKDATYIQRFAAKLLDFDEEEKFLADVNVDGKINVKDATLIQKLLAKLVSSLPADTKPAESQPATFDEPNTSAAVTSSLKTEQTGTTDEESSSTALPVQSNPTKPVVTDPVESNPTKPVVTDPVETKPTKPVVTDPVESKPTEPVVTDPVESKPTKPVVTDPVESKPTKPVVTDPVETNPTKPVETTSVPTIPTPTNPQKPTKPSVDKDGYYDVIIRP